MVTTAPELNLIIRRIKDISFFVNEPAFKPNSVSEIKIDLNHTIGFNTEKKLINFTLRIILHYGDSNPQVILADLYVQNIFELQNMDSLMKPDGIAIPPDILVSIVGTSIAHGRALLTKNISGTAYQETILPLLNAHHIAEHFFPNAFNKKE